ncbi:hypothetical protein [Chitinasiproducens palmae]|uniref:Uncharacterized protein n=1 Tax=Chitinasiproducens palmae TaxID=1770053 RepID=A0A1H2PMS6_9BURK|nr:hypothetical protein [Chitinasiproducens palmae]SDV47949.1 hypothetical protein SAMN05216551_10425 [Chitinasiproducens palmae]
MQHNFRPAHRVVRRDTRELNVVCAASALNLVRKQLFNALRAIGLDASCVVVSRCNAHTHASLDATIQCRAGDEAKLYAIADSLRRQEGVSGANWRMPLYPALAA